METFALYISVCMKTFHLKPFIPETSMDFLIIVVNSSGQQVNRTDDQRGGVFTINIKTSEEEWEELISEGGEPQHQHHKR